MKAKRIKSAADIKKTSYFFDGQTGEEICTDGVPIEQKADKMTDVNITGMNEFYAGRIRFERAASK